jgi:NAD(P)-dependent dehydrogenase (short-subunit alcohol dehydrogenase family)
MSHRPAVLVTGAARRIGAVIAAAFSEAGYEVVIHYRSSRAAAQKLAACLPNARAIQCDLTDEAAISDMVRRLSEGFPNWRVLVNNASVFRPDPVDTLDPEVFDEAIATNVFAPVRLSQLFLEHARCGTGRRVIMVTDQKLTNPNPDFFSYTISKHALAGAVPMLAMGANNPADRIYALAPGAILPSHDQSLGETERSHRLNLLARKTGAEEIAAACLFLADGQLASGQTLYIDSGQHLLRQPRDVIYLARDEERRNASAG